MKNIMRTIRIYVPGLYQENMHLPLSKEASHHLVTVLRLPVNTPITVFNGHNVEAEGSLITAHKKEAMIDIHRVSTRSTESPLYLSLAQAISKGDKMDWVIQKAVELGVSDITPIISQHMAYKLDKEKLEKKQQHWQTIAINACEQCGRNFVPTVNHPMTFDAFIKGCDTAHKLLLDPSSQNKLSSLEKTLPTTLMIGPEGGFSNNEVVAAASQGFLGKSLGPRILRTETAALTAIALLQATLGDL